MRHFAFVIVVCLAVDPAFGQPMPDFDTTRVQQGSQNKPGFGPWPLAAILGRENEAACEIEQLVVEGSEAAKQDAQKVVNEKEPAIRDQQDIAKNANKKRENGGITVETGMKRTGFSLHMPETVISYDDTSIGTVHIKVAETSVLLPAIGQCAVGSWHVPEFRGLEVTMKRQTIYVPCPTQKKVILSLPQFTAGRTNIRLPQVKIRMARKDVSFHVPQFTYRDWEKVENAARKKAAVEEDLARQALEEIKTRRKGKTAEAIRQTLKRMYEAAIVELDARYKADIEAIDKEYSKFVEAKNNLQKDLIVAGADPNASFPFEEMEAQFIKYRADLRQPYDTARALIDGNFNSLTERYLGPVVAEMGTGGGFFCGEPQSTVSTGQ